MVLWGRGGALVFFFKARGLHWCVSTGCSGSELQFRARLRRLQRRGFGVLFGLVIAPRHSEPLKVFVDFVDIIVDVLSWPWAASSER
jgi:hypothetical protein